MTKVYITGFLLFHLSSTSALLCLTCDNVADVRECVRVNTCGPNQRCFSERVMGNHGIPMYTLGCTNQFTCDHVPNSVVGKRKISSNHSVLTHSRDSHASNGFRVNDLVEVQERRADSSSCLQCCNNTDGCNKGLCGATPKNSLRCMACNDVKEMKNCDTIRECSTDQYCYVHKGINPNLASYEVRLDTGCMGSLQCNAFQKIYPTSCVKCCNHNDLCNYDACDGWTPASSPPVGNQFITRTTTPKTTTTAKPQAIINGPDKGNYMGQVNLSCITVPPAQTYYWKFNGKKYLLAGDGLQGLDDQFLSGHVLLEPCLMTSTLPRGIVTQQIPTTSMAGTDTLTIPSLTESTYGTYTCIASISGRIVEHTHFIGIHKEPPTVSLTNTAVSNNFAIQCKTTGYPVPNVRWDFIPQGARPHGIPSDVQIGESTFQSTLFVSHYVPLRHNGIWYCKVVNSLGSAISSVHIP